MCFRWFCWPRSKTRARADGFGHFAVGFDWRYRNAERRRTWNAAEHFGNENLHVDRLCVMSVLRLIFVCFRGIVGGGIRTGLIDWNV